MPGPVQPQYQTFGGLQQQGVARPPKPTMSIQQGGGPGVEQPQGAPGAAPQHPNMPQQNGMPDLGQAYQQMYNSSQPGKFTGGGGANFQPGNYQGPGNLHAYQGSNFAGPQVQAQGHFQAPGAGQQVDQQTQGSIQQALLNPSRYGGEQAKNTFDIFNRQLTQQGNADKQMIDEDMARRGIYASTTAGGRLGDLATNLNQQRSDYATNLSTDQARQYQTDRSSAIAQGLGFGGQQFSQGLAGFGANQGAGQQRFEQQLGAGQFGLGQNAQNFGQQLQQYGANQGEAQNRYNAGLSNAQFGLGQQGQNYGQQANTFGLNQQAGQQGYNQQMGALQGLQGFGQQGFNNQMATAGFNAQQDQMNTQLMMQMLGMT